MKKLLIIMLTVFALMPVFAVDLSASAVDVSKSGIFDGYDFFDDAEEQELTRLIQDKAEQLDMNIFVFIAGAEQRRKSDYDTECFADDTYDELYGEDTDGVFYFMDFSGRKPAYDYISTSGKAVLFYESHIQDIFSRLNKVLPSSDNSDFMQYKDDISQAVQLFLTELEYYKGKTSGYYYDRSSGKYFYYKNDKLMITTKPPLHRRLIPLAVALPFGFMVSVMFYFATKSKYKFKVSANPTTYVSHEKTVFTVKNDIYIRTHTTKTKIESSSSSGGSHGGGGHSHSGGHGGGGSHR
ncbi:MAG: TPM domain-containing protein [Ruminococcus sp.]|nr:TPM domain-containing protein [Ruminococcus sp.]